MYYRYARTREARKRALIRLVGMVTAITLRKSGLLNLMGSHTVTIEEIPLQIRNLPQSLIGTRFAQISDLHMGPHFGAEDLYPSIVKINELQPEFLLITGDYVCDANGRVNDMLSPLLDLTVPTYAIMGNHDTWGHGWSIERVLAQASVHLMWNESAEVKPHLWLAGLDDVLCGRPNLRRALADANLNETTLLMVHEPDYFCKIVDDKTPIDAQFSGHTHGGQVRLPALRQSKFGSRMRPYILPTMGKIYVMGHYMIGHQSLYVNRGLGFTGPPLRLNCPPEISIFSLEPAMNSESLY